MKKQNEYKNKKNIYISGRLFCPLSMKEQKLEKCFKCEYYKGVSVNIEKSHALVSCNY